MNRAAILITSFNRKQVTLTCLGCIYGVAKNLDVYLVDDSSTDGTSESIRILFPKVTIIQGNGNLFWNRGMNLAWKYAAKYNYDYYIWLNDDTWLYENSLIELFNCSKLCNDNAIITGIIEANDKSEIIYGGTNSKKQLIVPNGKLNLVTNMNGNVVLVPKAVFEILGNLDPVYHHDLGDVDYGLRARKAGISVYTTRIAVASGKKNNVCRVRLSNVSLKKRYERLYSPLGNHPIINFHFRKKHYGVLNAIIYFIHIHFINILPDSLIKIIFGNRYT